MMPFFKEKYGYKIVILNFALLFILGLTISKFSTFITNYFELSFKINFPSSTKPYFLYISLILVPILEEFTFRAPLKLNKKTISFFSIGITYFLLRFFLSSNLYLYKLGIAISIGIVIYVTFNKIKLRTSFYNTYYNGIVYLSAILFGVGHILNVDLQSSSFIAIVLYIFPIFFGGLILSYLRVKYNLLTSIMFHAIHNSVPFLVYYIFK